MNDEEKKYIHIKWDEEGKFDGIRFSETPAETTGRKNKKNISDLARQPGWKIIMERIRKQKRRARISGVPNRISPFRIQRRSVNDNTGGGKKESNAITPSARDVVRSILRMSHDDQPLGGSTIFTESMVNQINQDRCDIAKEYLPTEHILELKDFIEAGSERMAEHRQMCEQFIVPFNETSSPRVVTDEMYNTIRAWLEMDDALRDLDVEILPLVVEMLPGLFFYEDFEYIIPPYQSRMSKAVNSVRSLLEAGFLEMDAYTNKPFWEYLYLHLAINDQLLSQWGTYAPMQPYLDMMLSLFDEHKLPKKKRIILRLFSECGTINHFPLGDIEERVKTLIKDSRKRRKNKQIERYPLPWENLPNSL